MANAINRGSPHWVEATLLAPLHAVVGWYRVSQERAELRQMPAERLRDVGLTQREAERESTRPFWQAQREN